MKCGVRSEEINRPIWVTFEGNSGFKFEQHTFCNIEVTAITDIGFLRTVHLYERTECINIENHANIVTVPNFEIKRFVWNFIYLESIWSKWWTSKDFKNEANTVISIKCINENLQCYFSLKCFVQSISVYKCLKDDNISILLKIVHMP